MLMTQKNAQNTTQALISAELVFIPRVYRDFVLMFMWRMDKSVTEVIEQTEKSQNADVVLK